MNEFKGLNLGHLMLETGLCVKTWATELENGPNLGHNTWSVCGLKVVVVLCGKSMRRLSISAVLVATVAPSIYETAFQPILTVSSVLHSTGLVPRYMNDNL